MSKLAGILLVYGLMTASVAQAQSVIWGFDDDNNEQYIPIQCDGQFNAENGGVFMPTIDQLYEQGELFLSNADKTQQSNAAYCFISAALQGHVPAQYRVAQLYEKGIGVPQNDLITYKWAYLASLSGHEEASRLALTLERFLTSEDIELATKDIQELIPQIQSKSETELQKAEAELQAKRDELEEINREIDELLGIEIPEPETDETSEPNVDSTPKQKNTPSVNQPKNKTDLGKTKQNIKQTTEKNKTNLAKGQKPSSSAKNFPKMGKTAKKPTGKSIFNEKDRFK